MKHLTKLSVILTATLVLTLCLFASPTKANAVTVDFGTCGENLAWELDDNGTLTISGTGAMTLDSNTPWYSQKESIRKVVILDGVTNVSERAFYDYNNLTSVSIGNGATSIGASAFYSCSGLISVSIGNGVTSIGFQAFSNCTGLTSVTIPDSVTSIGDWAFSSCTNLTSVTIGDSVTYIGDWAFSSCSSLTSVHISDIAAWCNISFSDLLSNPIYYAKKLYLDGRLVTDLVIPDGVTVIPDYSFFNCACITSVTIPDSVTSIGERAFYSCHSLARATIGNGVTSIGDSAFAFCNVLSRVTIGNSITGIGENAFEYCKSLTSVHITDMAAWCNISFTGYYSNPIYYAKKLYLDGKLVTDLVIPNNVTVIGRYAFACCNSITGMTIPDSVTSIGASAFYNCDNLIRATIPASVTSIGSYIFAYCDSLTGIYVDANNPSYSSDAHGVLFNKDKTKLIQAPGDLCGSYRIPDSVIHIRKYAFRYCEKLTSVTIPDSVTILEDYAFSDCVGLTQIQFNPINMQDLNSNNYVFNKCGENATGIQVTIGSKVEKIPANLFCSNDAPKLTSISFEGKSVCGSIGEYAFDSCTNLTNVTIPKSVTNIDNWAFYACDSIQEVYYRGSRTQWGLISIGQYNSGLTSATIYYNCFPDVKSNAWYFKAVDFAVEKGYFSGNDDGTFAPGKNITRQDFVVVLSRIAGANLSQYSGKTNFADVPSNAYYAKAIHWATDNGIISGYNATKFGVGDSLTREQLVTILSRYAQKKGVNITPSAAALNKMNTYSDASKINPYMRNAIAWALQNKVINGMTDTTIAPQGNATRAQVAAILMNINAYKVIPGI